jgi:hypothetical protein
VTRRALHFCGSGAFSCAEKAVGLWDPGEVETCPPNRVRVRGERLGDAGWAQAQALATPCTGQLRGRGGLGRSAGRCPAGQRKRGTRRAPSRPWDHRRPKGAVAHTVVTCSSSVRQRRTVGGVNGRGQRARLRPASRTLRQRDPRRVHSRRTSRPRLRPPPWFKRSQQFRCPIRLRQFQPAQTTRRA